MNLQRYLLFLGFFILNTIAVPLKRDFIKRQTDSDIKSEVTYIYNNYINPSSSTIKSDFTGEVVSRLVSDYPGWNVLIYHVAHNDDDPKLCAPAPAYNIGFELPLPGALGQTYGYQIVLLENGSLNMNGNAGGYDNWRYGGPSYSDTSDEGYVTFGSGCPG